MLKPTYVNRLDVYQRDDLAWSQWSIEERKVRNPWKLIKSVSNSNENGLWHEVEVSRGVWQENTPLSFGAYNEDLIADSSNNGVNNELCQSHKSNQPCDSRFFSLERASEWHGLVYVEPDLSMLISSESNALKDIQFKVVAFVDSYDDEAVFRENSRYISYLKVKLGQKLPKFDLTRGPEFVESSLSEWAYGDLHFHSQGTDNTGEMGYSYRSALQAMNAMGLDFAIASDHASNNTQVSFINVAEGSSIIDQLFIDPFRELANLLSVDTQGWGIDWLEDPELFGKGDMSPTRWTNHWYLLNGEEGNVVTQRIGSNAVSERVHDGYHSTPSTLNVPKLILGGEVDAAPET